MRPAFSLAFGMLMLAGCRMVDQTTFDPALRARIFAPKPKPVAVVATAAGPPPLLTIRFDHDVDYATALRQAVMEAIARKPDVRFRVVTAVPDTGSLDDQISAVRDHADNARHVASDILADGVDAGQVDLGAETVRGLQGHEVRVYVQ